MGSLAPGPKAQKVHGPKGSLKGPTLANNGQQLGPILRKKKKNAGFRLPGAAINTIKRSIKKCFYELA